MTKEDAMVIKKWWTEGKPWSEIAKLAAARWPEWGVTSGNVSDGIGLCGEARRTLRQFMATEELSEDGW